MMRDLRRTGFAAAATLCYVLIAALWTIAPDLLLAPGFKGRQGVLGAMALDLLFAFVSAALLYLALQTEQMFAPWLRSLRARFGWRRVSLNLAAVAAFGLFVLAWMAMPDLLLSRLADATLRTSLAALWDLLYIALSGALIFLHLRRAETPPLFQARRQAGWQPYLFAACATVLVLVIRSGLMSVLGTRTLLILFFLPVSLSALLGGLGPGLLSTVLVTVYAAHDFLVRHGTHILQASGDMLSLSLLLLNGVLVSALSEYLLRSGSRVKALAKEQASQILRLEALNALNLAILSADEPDTVAASALAYLRRLVPYWGATAMVFDWQNCQGAVLAIERDADACYDPGQQVALSDYGLGDLARLAQGQSCVESDLGAVVRPAFVERLYHQGMRSYLRIPLLAEGRLLGVLNLSSNTLGAFSRAQQEAAEACAQQLAMVLQQALLRQRIARLNRVYAVQSGINALIVRCHARDELFREACRIAVDSGAYKMAWLGLLDEHGGEGRIVASQGAPAELLQTVRISVRSDSPYGARPANQALRRREIVVSNDLQADSSMVEAAAILARHQMRATACLPLQVDERAVAVLTLFADSVGAFDSEEMPLLEELANDISFALDHIRKEERLDYLAFYDSLTGLANRTLFGERLARQSTFARLEEQQIAVVLLDVERFKSINDTYGRAAGDHLLKQLAGRLEQQLDAPLLARLQADQFVLMLPAVKTEEEAVRRVEALQAACLEAPFELGTVALRAAAKYGIAIYPDDGAEADVLLANAEAALKRAKRAGEQFLFYRQEMTQRAVAALALENRLRHAVASGQFVLFYQPKVDGRTRRIVALEALLRWDSPELGLMQPGQFIALLEETGMIAEVGAWALAQAARDYHGWRSAGLAAPRIAVNVSAKQLRRADFLPLLEAALAQYPDENGLDLEITESLIMEDIEQNIDKLHQVRRLGPTIALDDFGTGYSSLAYLAKLPVQTLKIDRAFIIAMLEQSEAMSMVEMIISLAHAMELKVVAEGVETEAQAAMLTELGCDQMQGYLFSRPLPLADMTRLLAESGQPERQS